MKRSIFLNFIIIISAISSFSAVDLVAPFSVDIKIGQNSILDTVIITTYLQNRGSLTAYSPFYPNTYTSVIIGIDSLNLKSHSTSYLSSMYFIEYKDTIKVIKGPFSIHTWIDPLGQWGEGGAEINNNVRSQSFNLYPEIYYDTVFVVKIDTLTKHDTTLINIKDTIIINKIDTLIITKGDTTIINKLDTIVLTKTDTIFKTDTIKVYEQTNNNHSLSKISNPRYVNTIIYNVLGQKVYEGNCIDRSIPKVNLPIGNYVLYQGQKKRLLQITYK